ncbi:TonB family protein [Beijerinckia indica]|uniref:TonB family protein n=1 Tax=Beijerinckia indica subsp. indica (strain ATCC 9039 / DSM 1715 / NCIMB 8712) TaxID=395963 RepID=B2IBJ9_BEII9|nr:energy transducer TonB [Beijerinckia indica]ACB96625.1 TonB family protein [Beijerinckia indica subsp. indica ATCC 9039]
MSQGKSFGRTTKFTLYHGFALSLGLHAALAIPFGLHALEHPPEEEDIPPLVVELQGLVSTNQSNEKLLQETKGEAKQADAASAAQPEAKPMQDDGPQPETDQPTQLKASEQDKTEKKDPEKEKVPEVAETSAPSPAHTASNSSSAGTNNTKGTEEQQKAQTIRNEREAELNRLKEYIKSLTKKVQTNLAYPDQARQSGLQGTPTVSFTVLPSGQIRMESLRIVASSGKPELDQAAVKTVRASVPFNPPPKEMTVAIAVSFGRKH